MLHTVVLTCEEHAYATRFVQQWTQKMLLAANDKHVEKDKLAGLAHLHQLREGLVSIFVVDPDGLMLAPLKLAQGLLWHMGLGLLLTHGWTVYTVRAPWEPAE